MVDSGINKLLEIQKKQQDRQTARTKHELYNKLFGLLKSIPGKGTSDHNEFCGKLSNMTLEDQRQAILEAYGSVCLTKVEPLLYQLVSMTR